MRSLGLFLLALALPLAHADEGMWQPHQLPKISKQLQTTHNRVTLTIKPSSKTKSVWSLPARPAKIIAARFILFTVARVTS